VVAPIADAYVLDDVALEGEACRLMDFDAIQSGIRDDVVRYDIAPREVADRAADLETVAIIIRQSPSFLTAEPISREHHRHVIGEYSPD
jgi:hypothetical protein